MQLNPTRRDFIKSSAAAAACVTFAALPLSSSLADDKKKGDKKKRLFKISLAEYSLHRMIGSKKLDPLEFPAYSKKTFRIRAVEYWNRPFFTKAQNSKYIGEMKKRADDAGVKGLLIMIDGEGALGDPDEKKRIDAVQRHYKWIEAAKQLGCHSIRVNAQSRGEFAEQMKLAADGLRRLSEFGAKHNMNVIVENHGGLSSNGQWLSGVMKIVGMKNCGTLPDFGNFHGYDRYKGVTELMPFAKAVSAKTHEFDAQGNETRTDYFKMMKIVVDAGYHGFVGIEYEGSKVSEVEGVKATKKLLQRVRRELAS